MKPCHFYEIQSQKSKEIQDGLRQIAFGCKNRANVHGFIWLDETEKIQQIQLIFDEIVLEWRPEMGVLCQHTNRSNQKSFVIGIHKGSRSLQEQVVETTLNSILEEIKIAVFPQEWTQAIQNKFNVS